MREVVLDTETTGLKRKGNGGSVCDGHRIIEIACVELINGEITGRKFHALINPGCKIDKKATSIHGITSESLKGKPKFEEIAGELIDFIQDSVLIIHNAPFDIQFLDQEFRKLKKKDQPQGNFDVVDTLEMARRLYPNMKNDLNSLAEHFKIDIQREKHSALVDSEILARVYLNMIKL